MTAESAFFALNIIASSLMMGNLRAFHRGTFLFVLRSDANHAIHCMLFYRCKLLLPYSISNQYRINIEFKIFPIRWRAGRARGRGGGPAPPAPGAGGPAA